MRVMNRPNIAQLRSDMSRRSLAELHGDLFTEVVSSQWTPPHQGRPWTAQRYRVFVSDTASRNANTSAGRGARNLTNGDLGCLV